MNTNLEQTQRDHLGVRKAVDLVQVKGLEIAATELCDRLQRGPNPSQDAHSAGMVQRC